MLTAIKNRKLCEEWKGPFIITKVFSNQTALIKTKFGKHETLYNFKLLKHYNYDETKSMAKTPEEAENMSKDNKNTKIQRTPVNEGPITRSKTRELEKLNQPKTLYSDVLKNSAQNICAQQNSVHNKTLRFGAQNSAKGAQKLDARKTSVQTDTYCTDQQK